MCDEHAFNRRQARQTLMAMAVVGALLGFVVTLVLFGGGCAVDTSGTGVTDAATSEDDALMRGDTSGRIDAGGGPDVGVPEAPDAVDADGGGPDGYPDASDVTDSGVESHPPRCPAVVPIDGCMGGTLSYPTGDITCCIPVDWEGYRVHCPQPKEGCRWGYGSFDGWIGECCA